MTSTWNIINAEIITWAKAYTGPRFHHIISDPPYALEFLGMSWDKPMGTDNSDLSGMQQYQHWVSEWSEALIANVLHPGATCAFFGGTRTFHRLAAGLEDGGFEIFDAMMWLYGQGMAKGQDIAKAVDGAAFKEWLDGIDHGLTPAEKRLVISAAMQGGISMEERHGRTFQHNNGLTAVSRRNLSQNKMANGVALLHDLIDRHWDGPAGTLPPGVRVKVGERIEKSGYKSINGNNASIGYRPTDYYADAGSSLPIALPATAAAQDWAGYNTGLKPAWEPVVLCRAPKQGKTYVYLAQDCGTGSLNIDAGRIAVSDDSGRWGSSNETCQPGFNGSPGNGEFRSRQHPQGRWPANLALAHVPGEVCPHCNGTGQVRWEQWYGRTKEYGGSREEWERLAGGAEAIECGQCHGRGEIGGCRPRGLTSIKGITGSLNGSWRSGDQYNGGYSGAGEADLWQAIGYANADGTETVEAWACVCGCDDCGTEWPAEALTDCPACGSDNTGWRCPVRLLDDQAGQLKSGSNNVRRGDREKGWSGFEDVLAAGTPQVSYGDTGTASRFFYVAKVSPWEADAGCEDLYWRSDPESPTGYRLVDKTEWETLPNQRRKQGNIHPTRKPIRLIEHLARILLAPRHVKPRVCVPFFGSGSEGAGVLLAAKSLGVNVEIVGIENESEYCRIAEKRLPFWAKRDSYETARRKPANRPVEPPAADGEVSVAVQTSFLGGSN